jgi:hypothetical protein
MTENEISGSILERPGKPPLDAKRESAPLPIQFA